MMGTAKPTMKEIVAPAGVSKATVSRVMHSPHMVKPATRQKIQRLMAERKYVYNGHAAVFFRSKTSMLGLIIPTLRGSICAEQIMGMQARILETTYALLIGHNNYELEIETNLLNLFIQRRLAGAILTGIKL
jgi:DNA-binding LacI/PurR family transcriptional regulator